MMQSASVVGRGLPTPCVVPNPVAEHSLGASTRVSLLVLLDDAFAVHRTVLVLWPRARTTFASARGLRRSCVWYHSVLLGSSFSSMVY